LCEIHYKRSAANVTEYSLVRAGGGEVVVMFTHDITFLRLASNRTTKFLKYKSRSLKPEYNVNSPVQHLQGC